MTQETKHAAVFVEPTPNPNSLKFIVGRKLIDGGPYDFASADEAADSPLARRLFEIEGVAGVYVGANFVSVRKIEAGDWGVIEPRATSIIETMVASGEELVSKTSGGTVEHSSDAEATIRRILDEEIRPAVASDGGDVVFQSYANGILNLRLVGSCSGCPSSLMTLRMGIERRLREDVPELVEVVSE